MLNTASASKLKTARLVGAVLAITHLLAFLVFAYYLQQSDDGQAILLWSLWLPVDFPVSMTVLAGFELISPDDGIGSAFRRSLPYFVHGILGTVWWYFLPILISAILQRITRKVD